MSTGLILGIAGAAIGFFTGGVGFIGVGFLAGSLIGNLIDPPKVEGPRLSDLKIQTSTYGKMIPWVWGKGRLAGNVIDQTDLIEHKQKSGGKGGPEVTSYTYSATWAIALCQTPIFGRDAIVGVLRLWADGRLIWDSTNGDDIPCTVYVGSEDQLPDPTLEAIHGVGSTPAYRGIAYLIFADYSLTDFGNRIPQIEAEVFTSGGDIPWRVSTFAPWDAAANTNDHGATLTDGIITTSWSDNSGIGADSAYREQWDIYGNVVTPTAGVGWSTTAYSPGASFGGGFANNTNWMNAYGGGLIHNWAKVNDTGTDIVIGSSFGNVVGTTAGTVVGDFCFFAINSGTTHIERFSAPGGVLGDQDGALVDLGVTVATSTVCFGGSDDGFLYVKVPTGVGLNCGLWKFDTDLNLIHFWDQSETSVVGMQARGSFFVYKGLLVNSRDYGPSDERIELIKIDAGYALSNYGGTLSHSVGDSIHLGAGLMLDKDGVYSLDPPASAVILGQIVGDLSDNTPVPGYDVSELTDEVRWFVVATQMASRNAIASLRPPFAFDAREHDGIAQFKKRGGAAIAIIPDGILCARPYGDDSGDPLKTTRQRETALPRTVSMNYIDVDNDYQVGVQSSPRQTTLSQQDVTVEVPVGFTAEEAAQKCWMIQSAEWIERETFEWSTTRGGKIYSIATDDWMPACVLEPCDVVIVRGREIRILTAKETPNGVINWTGVLSAPSIYTSQTAPGAAGGFTPPSAPGSAVSTELILLDIPYRNPSGNPYGFTAAMGPRRDGRWTGAGLYKSLDGGVTWSVVASTESPNTIGRTSEDSGSPFISGELGVYFGGDVLDSTEIRVVLTDDDATLESVTDAALALGANLCAVARIDGSSPLTGNWELCQFRDAVLVDVKTYVLSNWLRARHGTDTDGHANGDTFVMLPATNVDAPQSELNESLKYKAVTYGTALGDATAQDFTNTGLGIPWWAGSSGIPGGGFVPPPSSGSSPGVCDPTYFLNECRDWAVPGVGGSVPTGTGFRHVTGGAEDGTAVAVDLSSAHATGTLAAGRFPALTGDVTTVAGALASTIAANVVTVAKMHASATDVFFGRDTAGAGAGEEISVSAAKTLLNLTGTNSGDQPAMIVLAPAYSGTVTVDLTSYSAYAIVVVNVGTLTGNITFNITNGTDGQIIRARFTQDGTGSRIFTAGANLRFSAATPLPALTLTASKMDRFAFEWHAGAGMADLIATNKGY